MRNAADLREQEIRKLVGDEAAVRALYRACRQRFIWAAKALEISLGGDEELGGEVRTTLLSALAMGYCLAQLRKFMEAEGLDHEWLLAQRRANPDLATDGRDRSQDWAVVARARPELLGFHGSVERIDVLLEASYVVYDLLVGRGTNYHQHQVVSRGSNGRSGSRSVHTDLAAAMAGEHSDASRLVVYDGLSGEDEPCGYTLAVLPREQPASEEDEILSAVSMDVLLHLTRRFGPRPALYWAWRRLRDVRSTRALVRLFSPAISDVDEDRLRKDLDRKLPAMDAAVQELRGRYEDALPMQTSERVPQVDPSRSDTLREELIRSYERRGIAFTETADGRLIPVEGERVTTGVRKTRQARRAYLEKHLAA
jgi:hypothetical protein